MATFKNPVSIVKRAGGTAIIGEGTIYTLDTPANQPLNLTPMGDTYQSYSPAPTPSSPQPITVVTGEQTVTVSDGNSNTQTFTFDLKKNKVDGAYSNIVTWIRSTGSAYGNGFTITSTQSSGATYAVLPIPDVADLLGKEVTLSCTNEGTGTLTRIFYLNGGSATTQIAGLSGNGGTFTMPASISAGNDGIGICFYTSNNASASYTNIQLEIGDTATSFTPIIELCKFGDYQDFLWTDGIKWYKHKELGKQTLVSSMFHEMHNLTAVDYAKIDKPTDYLAYDKYINVPVIASCAEYTSRTSGDSLDNVKWLGKILSEPSKPYFYVGLDNGTTQAQAISLLGGSTIYYPLATFVEEEITDTILVSDLNTMKSALSYSPTTNISSGTPGSDLPVIAGSAVITGV